MPSFDRLYTLHRALEARRTPASESVLMGELECSRATFYRVLRVMRDHLDAPIVHVPGRGYLYDQKAGSFELPGIWFRPEELESLLVIDHLLESVQPGLLQEQLDPIRRKLNDLLDRGVVKRRKPFPKQRFRILRSHGRHVSAAQLTAVATAVVGRNQLAFSYRGRLRGDTTQRTVSPQRLVYYRDQWYLDAWDEAAGGLRTFAIDRIDAANVLDIPSRDVEEAELDVTLTPGYGIFAGPAAHVARLVFTAERARWVADETWHPDQSGRVLSDGRYELTVPYSDGRELIGEILRHGAGVQVIEPAELVAAVAVALKQASRQYS